MAKITEIIMDEKFVALKLTAYALFVLAGAATLYGFYNFAKSNDFLPQLGYLYLGGGITFGLILAALGQICLVQVQKEWNQRETNELLAQIIKNQPEQP